MNTTRRFARLPLSFLLASVALFVGPLAARLYIGHGPVGAVSALASAIPVADVVITFDEADKDFVTDDEDDVFVANGRVYTLTVPADEIRVVYAAK